MFLLSVHYIQYYICNKHGNGMIIAVYAFSYDLLYHAHVL